MILKLSKSSDAIPETGSHPKFMQNRFMRSSASQNSGVENPMNTNMVVSLSGSFPLLTALVMPRGIPMNNVSSIAEKFIRIVIIT